MVMHDVDNSSFYMTRYHIYFFFTVEWILVDFSGFPRVSQHTIPI
jgi:hypothetical protein